MSTFPVADFDMDCAVCYLVTSVSRLRSKWLFTPARAADEVEPSVRPFDPFECKQVPPPSGHSFVLREGVFHVFAPEDAAQEVPLYAPGTRAEYYEDLRAIMRVVEHGPSKTFCFRRLMLLEARFNMHMLLNENIELGACKRVASRDFYNVRKVDTVWANIVACFVIVVVYVFTLHDSIYIIQPS